ncbi:hypothetical protein [Micromonospora cathayae]|uniref:Uncharacterized protein n=1 Tax=Micromonospora cathayae TaxID=3028804 RepID=A0ABY7ZPD8_9ACTN|nr:hypothetical protein [Micromonospora sp. HUAS 3]WDZ83739.1 hypothetical protein PVK37_25235 [Micromonospora sp. HUAS 3]
MPDGIEPVPLKAWKRERPTPPATPTGRPPMCGGPEYTVAQRLELMREKQRAMDEAARREREAAEQADAREAAKRRAAKPADPDDEYATGRPNPDRYAVTLLRQDESAWGGGGAGTGVLG